MRGIRWIYPGLLCGAIITLGAIKLFSLEPIPDQVYEVVQDAVVLAYGGNHYVVGYVDTLGTPRLLEANLVAFLLSQAKDRGIRDAAEWIKFTGPIVTVQRDSSNVP